MLFLFLKPKAGRLHLLTPAIGLILITLLSSSNKHYEPFQSSVSQVDIKKFAGEWFIISNIPYFAEKNKVGSKTNYRPNNNQFDDIFTSQEGSFDAPIDVLKGSAKSTNQSNTQWQSTFYWLIKFNFEVIYINDNYSIMLLAHKSRNYGWVMSRTATVPNSTITKAMKVFANNGYDISKFNLVPQHPEQMSLINKSVNEVYNLDL